MKLSIKTGIATTHAAVHEQLSVEQLSREVLLDDAECETLSPVFMLYSTSALGQRQTNKVLFPLEVESYGHPYDIPVFIRKGQFCTYEH